MVIDVYAFPGFLKEICQDPDRVAFRREQYFLYKQHVWPMELFMKQLNAAGIDKCGFLWRYDQGRLRPAHSSYIDKLIHSSSI